MIVAEILGANDTVEISLHEFLDKIDLVEVIDAGWAENVKDGNDVFVVKVAEELDFAESAQTEHGMVKRRDALDCDFALRWRVHRRPASSD